MSRVPDGCLLVKVLKTFDYLSEGDVLVMPWAVARPLIAGGVVVEAGAHVRAQAPRVVAATRAGDPSIA